MAEKKTYSIVRGVVKSLKVMAVFSIVALLIGLKPEIKELTIGGALLLILNFAKVKWGVKIPWFE